MDLERAALAASSIPSSSGSASGGASPAPLAETGVASTSSSKRSSLSSLRAPEAADSSALSPVSTSARYSATKEPSATLPERPRLSTNASSREVAKGSVLRMLKSLK